PLLDVGKELLGRLAGALELVVGGVVGDAGEQAALASGMLQLVEQPVEAAAADLDAEVVGGDGFERVGLVEDDRLVVGQDVAALLADFQVAEEQGVIDDEDLGAVHLLAGTEIEALGVVGTGPAKAVARVAVDRIPHHGQGLEAQVALAALPTLPGPPSELREL